MGRALEASPSSSTTIVQDGSTNHIALFHNHSSSHFTSFPTYLGLRGVFHVAFYSARWELSVFLIFTSGEACLEVLLLILFRNL